MKRILILILLVFNIFLAEAQTEGITYQAVLVDNNPDEIPGVDVPANSLANQPLSVRFSILNVAENTEYQEIHSTETDAYGTINLVIGRGEVTSNSQGAFDQINWDGPKNLRVEIDLEAGTNFTEFSFQELTYIPYVRHRNIIADGDANVMGNTVLGGPTDILDRLTVRDTSEFLNKVTIRTTPQQTDQTNYESYPLQLESGFHGMAIRLNQINPGRNINYMSFWDGNGNAIGRVEGFRAFTDISGNFLLQFIKDSAFGDDDVENQNDEDVLEAPPLPSAFQQYLNNDYGLNYFLEYTDLLYTSFQFGVNLAPCIATASVAGDCDDAVWAGVDIVVQGLQLGAFIWYNEANKGVAFESGGADYAEWLKKYNINEKFAYGDVVGVKAGQISKSFIDAEKFMVISKDPIVSGAMPQESKKDMFKQVAFIGQVPVKVIGQVNKGDYILPSGNMDGMGIAVRPENMRVNDYRRIIGVAWDEYHGNDLFSYINVAVGINSNDLVKEIEKMQILINSMQSAITEMNPNYKPIFFETGTTSFTSKYRNTSKSKPMRQLVMEKYGLDKALTPSEALQKLNYIMGENDEKSVGFSFSELPYLKEMIKNPSPENIQKFNDEYAILMKGIDNIMRSIN
ncbi:hypothetical protein [Maribacter sp. 2210JD10-5]|uniref:hypothetical protein n=1 Tax=Maribacter sp. 2210JD10-5 TaxID=3386272 RepID=UPI0039BC3158